MHVIRKTDLPFIGSSYNFVGADNADVGVSIYLIEAQPGRGAPLHIHEYDEILLVQEGRSRVVRANAFESLETVSMKRFLPSSCCRTCSAAAGTTAVRSLGLQSRLS